MAPVALALAGLFLALYTANVLTGKIGVLYGTHVPRADDVAEFLLLFIAVICFVGGTLLLERRRDRSQQNPDGGNHGQ
jgi:hypothetical protein